MQLKKEISAKLFFTGVIFLVTVLPTGCNNADVKKESTEKPVTTAPASTAAPADTTMHPQMDTAMIGKNSAKKPY